MEEEVKDVSSYWMTFKKKATGHWKRKH